MLAESFRVIGFSFRQLPQVEPIRDPLFSDGEAELPNAAAGRFIDDLEAVAWLQTRLASYHELRSEPSGRACDSRRQPSPSSSISASMPQRRVSARVDVVAALG